MHATTLAPFKGRFTDGPEGLQRALSGLSFWLVKDSCNSRNCTEENQSCNHEREPLQR